MVVLQRFASHFPLLPVSSEEATRRGQQMQSEGEYGEVHDIAVLQVRQVSDALQGPHTKKLAPWSRALLAKSTAVLVLWNFSESESSCLCLTPSHWSLS
jgi:hypothetical protein